jgi:hypothetical protein
MEKKVGISFRNGAIIGGLIAATYGFYAFGKSDVGRIVGIGFLGAVLGGWANGAIANKKNVSAVEKEMEA